MAVDTLALIFSLGFGYCLGLITGIYYLKQKMMSNLGTDELNPNKMMDQVEDMLGDISDADPELESNDKTSERLDDILGDKDEQE
jgi:hypothetical protein